MRGFIIQASYRIQGGVPVVYLFGRLEDGDTFLVRDHRHDLLDHRGSEWMFECESCSLVFGFVAEIAMYGPVKE